MRSVADEATGKTRDAVHRDISGGLTASVRLSFYTTPRGRPNPDPRLEMARFRNYCYHRNNLREAGAGGIGRFVMRIRSNPKRKRFAYFMDSGAYGPAMRRSE